MELGGAHHARVHVAADVVAELAQHEVPGHVDDAAGHRVQIHAQGRAVVHAGQHGQRRGHHAHPVGADAGAGRGGPRGGGAAVGEVDGGPVVGDAPGAAGADDAQRRVSLGGLGAGSTELPAHVDERRGVAGGDVVVQRTVDGRPRVVDPGSHSHRLVVGGDRAGGVSRVRGGLAGPAGRRIPPQRECGLPGSI